MDARCLALRTALRARRGGRLDVDLTAALPDGRVGLVHQLQRAHGRTRGVRCPVPLQSPLKSGHRARAGARASHHPSRERARTMPRRVIIMGAAGRDFHNFNSVYRDDPATEVVAFTATQIPYIDDRTYPAALAGPAYPQGIPIFPEERLEDLIAAKAVQEVVFSYSDVRHVDVMHVASRVLAAGADFRLLGRRETELVASVPVVAVCAVRTGSGKSQPTRRVAEILRAAGRKGVAVRHPLPYGDLASQAVQRFSS